MNREPVAIVAAVEAVIIALVAFGLPVTAEQLSAITGALLLVLGLFVRQQVTSPATLERQYVRRPRRPRRNAPPAA